MVPPSLDVDGAQVMAYSVPCLCRETFNETLLRRKKNKIRRRRTYSRGREEEIKPNVKEN
jgi:hypothetical protein